MDNEIIRQLKYIKWKLTWSSSRWRCNKTGTIFTFPTSIREGDLFSFGDSAIDVGNQHHQRFLGDISFVDSPHKKLVEFLEQYLEGMEKDNG